MKQLLAIFAMLSAPAFAFAQGGTLTPTGPASYSSVAPITINANWSSSTNAAAIQFSWTSSVSVTGITLAPIVGSAKQILCGGTFPQTSGTCLIWGMNTSPIANGAVSVIAATPSGSAAISVSTSNVLASDSNGITLGASTGGALSIPFVPPISKCDLDASGATDGNDVTTIAKRITAKPQVTPCDLNADGSCDIFDLFVVLKAALGGVCTAP